MSNKKQTAVEWLEAYLKTYTSFNLHKIIEKAKEMDKQQKIEAYNQGEFNQGCNGSAEDYYRETYEDTN